MGLHATGDVKIKNTFGFHKSIVHVSIFVSSIFAMFDEVEPPLTTVMHLADSSLTDSSTRGSMHNPLANSRGAEPLGDVGGVINVFASTNRGDEGALSLNFVVGSK